MSFLPSPRLQKKSANDDENNDETRICIVDKAVKQSNILKAIGAEPQTRNLGRLTQLMLVRCSLKSPLPTEIFTELWALERLNLTGNELQELPSEISKLKRLRWLNVSMNKLEFLPHSFSQLTELKHLDLSLNRLTDASFPPSFFTLTSLERLYLSDNLLESFPPEFGQLENLRVLALRDNRIKSLSVRAFARFSMLSELHLQGNQLRFLPPTLASLPELTSSDSALRLSDNPWMLPIAEQIKIGNGVDHLMKYVGSEGYRIVYEMHHGRRSLRYENVSFDEKKK